MIMVVFIMEVNGIARERFVWSYEQVSGFMERQLLSGYSMKMFKQWTKLIPKTFHHLCNVVVLSLGRAIVMKSGIPFETQVTITLFHISSGNTLQMCGEVYEVVESIAFIIVRDFCIRKHLKPLVL